MSKEAGGWKRYLFGRDGTARVVAALVLFLVGYFLILAFASRIGTPFVSPGMYRIDLELEWLRDWHAYTVAYVGIAIVLASQLLYLVSIPAYRSHRNSSVTRKVVSAIYFLLPAAVLTLTLVNAWVNLYAQDVGGRTSSGEALAQLLALLAPFIGAAYLFFLLNELYFRVVSGDEPTEREKNRIMSETKSRLRRSILVMLTGGFLLFFFDLGVSLNFSYEVERPSRSTVFIVYTVVGFVLSMQAWYVICKPFYLTYSRKEGGNYETKRKIMKAIPYAVFGLAILEFAVSRVGLTKYFLISTYSLEGAISLSFPFQLLGFVFIYWRARKWIGWGDLEVSVSVEFDEAAEEATVTVEQPTDADSLEVLLNGEVKKEIENPYTGDEVTVEATERDKIEVNKKKSSHRLF